MIRAARAALVALLVSAGVALALDFGTVAGQVFTGGTVSGQAYSLPAAGGETTPATIFGGKLVAWYRPDTGHVSVDGSNNVTQLNDRSGNGHHFDVVGGTPLLVDVSGTPAIDFESGDGDALGRAAAIVAVEPAVFLVVADFESGTAVKSLLSISTDADANDQWYLDVNAAEVARFSAKTTVATAAAHGSTLSTGTRYVFFGEATADDSRRVNVNGGTEVVSSGTSRAASGMDYTTLGALRATGAFTAPHDGLIFEAVILNAVPSAGELTAYYAYTTARFGAP